MTFFTGICGGSASGKTTVAKKIIEDLGVPWVCLLSMDSFYKVESWTVIKMAPNIFHFYVIILVIMAFIMVISVLEIIINLVLSVSVFRWSTYIINIR